MAEVGHGVRVALVSGLLVPLARLGVVLRHAPTAEVSTAEAKLLTPQSGGARNCGPTGDFAANIVCKLIRPGVERIKTQLAKPFHCFRRMYRLLCSVGEFFNHRP